MQMRRALTSLRYLGVPLAVFLEQCLRSSNTLRNGLISSYRFMASDSYDYVTEGFYIATKLDGQVVSEPLPVLREPGLVAVAAGDALLFRGAGFFVLWVLAASSGLLALAILLIGRALTGAAPGIVTNALVLGAMLNPLAGFRYYVLSEHAALAFGFSSLLLALLATDALRVNGGGGPEIFERKFVQSAFAVLSGSSLLVSGLFRTDVALGFGVLVGLYALLIRRSGRSEAAHRRAALLVIISLMSALVVLATARSLWSSGVPHESVPEPLKFFRLPPPSLPHVATTTFIYFTPLAAFVLVCWLLVRLASSSSEGRCARPHNVNRTPVVGSPSDVTEGLISESGFSKGVSPSTRLARQPSFFLVSCLGLVSIAWVSLATLYDWQDSRLMLFPYYGLVIILTSVTVRCDSAGPRLGDANRPLRLSFWVRSSLALCIVVHIFYSATYDVDSIYSPTRIDLSWSMLDQPRFFSGSAFSVQNRYGIQERCGGLPFCGDMVIDDVSEYRTRVLSFLRDNILPIDEWGRGNAG